MNDSTQSLMPERSRTGRWNMIIGFWTMAAFMILGFILIYLRDFAPNAAEWAAQYGSGKHFETRLAHVHGALFGFLNVLIGYLLTAVPIKQRARQVVSVLALIGILMPVGILTEVLFGVPPLLVLIGALSMTAAMILHGIAIWKCAE
mgnify:CR=1 FL=1